MQTSLVCTINRAILHCNSVLNMVTVYPFFFAHKAANAVQYIVLEHVVSCTLVFSKKRTVHRFARSTPILRTQNDANIVFSL